VWGGVTRACCRGAVLRSRAGASDATNDRRATAAAMWYGCRRGEAFEGYEFTEGNPVRVRPLSGGERRDPAKLGEPQVRHRAATCPGPAVGGSRRGGAKPRGRNATSGLAATIRSLTRERRVGVDGRGCVGGGDPEDNPRRGRTHGDPSASSARECARGGRASRRPAPRRARRRRDQGEEAAGRIGFQLEPSCAARGSRPRSCHRRR